MKHWLSFPVALFFFSTLVMAQGTFAIDPQLLSGAWEGTEGQAQRGDCSIGGQAGPQTGIHYVPVRWIVNVAADGSFSAEIYYRAQTKPAEILVGKIDKDSNVELVASRVAGCNRQSRKYQITYLGKVIQKKGKYELELKGRDVACPEMKCVFERRIQLKKK
jgi:hypothetical protein